MTQTQSKPVDGPDACLFVSMEGLEQEAPSGRQRKTMFKFKIFCIVALFVCSYGITQINLVPIH